MDYLDSYNYKSLHFLYEFFRSRNIMNIIIYGNNEIYNDVKNILNILNYNIINIEKIDDINEIISTMNINLNDNLNDYKYLLLNNIKLNQNNNKKIKNIIEKTYKNIRFIIVTDYIYNYQILKPFCYIYHIKELSKYDKIIYNIEDNHINDFYDRVCNKIIKCYEMKKFKIQKIKEISYKIKLMNLDIQKLLGIFLNHIILMDIDITRKHKSVETISEYGRLIKTSYKELIYLESLFIRIYKLIYIDK